MIAAETVSPPRGRDEEKVPPVHYASPVIAALSAGLHPDKVDSWDSVDSQLSKDWRLLNHSKIQNGQYFWGLDVDRKSVGRGTGDALTNLTNGDIR